MKIYSPNNKKVENQRDTGDCIKTKARLKRKFALSTENDHMPEKGRKEEMPGRLQKKLGKTKEELRKIIAAL